MKKVILLIFMLVFCETQVFSQKEKSIDPLQHHTEMVKMLKKNEKQLKRRSRRSLFQNSLLKSAALVETGDTAKWKSIGPDYRITNSTSSTIGQGRIAALWVDPVNSNHILAGASSAGVWETKNGGDSWISITSEVVTGGVWDIAVDKNNPSTIYIATKNRSNGTLKWHEGYSMGLFKSTNSGVSWEKLQIVYQPDEYFEKIVIDPNNSEEIYACSSQAIYHSNDAGLSWKEILRTEKGKLNNLLFQPNESSVLYSSGDNQLFKTEDKGLTWIDLKNKLLGVFENALISIAVDETKPNYLYAFYSDLKNKNWEQTPNQIELSKNGGLTWEVLTSEKLSGISHTQLIRIAPGGEIFAGGITLKKANNNGSKFISLNKNGIHSDLHEVVFPDESNPEFVIAATDGGVFKSINGGLNWECINGNLTTNEFYGIDIHENNPGVMIGGTHDCGSYYRDTDGEWNYVYGGDGGSSLISQSNEEVFFVSSNTNVKNFNNKKILKFRAQLYEYDSPIVMDPIYSNVIYIQTDQVPRISKSPNSLFNKYQIYDDSISVTTLDKEWNAAQAIDICFSDPKTIYYGMWSPWSSSKIKRTTDGGISWEEVKYDGIEEICKTEKITAIYVHPYYPNQLWITFSGFEKDNKIFFSDNYGESWSNTSGTSLPNVPAQCIGYDFKNGQLYLGTDAGLYSKATSDAEWTYCEGFPKTIVSGIKLNKLSGDLVVASYGAGVWQKNIWTETK
ncbi:MAG: WD40/YVTN/BNR-like repeat-containing protein [Prolixibacteraceae bacterium]